MKKILCLSDGLMQGGAERQLLGLAHLLQTRKYEVTVAFYTDKVFYNHLLKDLNIKAIQLYPKPSMLSKLCCVGRLISENNYDWVIAYKDGATTIACILKMLRLKFNLIVSERNTTQKLNKRDKVKFWFYRFADYIVSNSYSQKGFITKHYPHYEKKTYVITNFTDIDYFKPNKMQSNTQPNGSLKILTVGRIADQKNVLNYLKAIKQLHDLDYNVYVKWIGVVSIGQELYFNKCNRFIKDNDMSEYFFFEPAKSDIKEEYLKCDVFCLPSNYEGFPNVICEAMACGKPILCSKVCDNPYLVVDEKNGYLFNQNDVSDIVSKIVKFYKLNKNERHHMCKMSRDLVITKCSEISFVQKYITLIDK